VGGPSAGLAFSLGVIDVLTPGELTGGERVAVTGTIDGNGDVGPVGGVAQKTAVVVDEGYDVFLVPRSEVEVARRRAGDHVRVVGVDTLREALDALESLGGSGPELASPPG
jgi:PDZ domain-containing protein